jgi:hypothetical protein
VDEEQWAPVGVTHEGGPGFTVDGISVWDSKWESQHRSVPVQHPQYPTQVHSGAVYAWPGSSPPLLLAVAEASMNVYAFAVSPPTAQVARG